MFLNFVLLLVLVELLLALGAREVLHEPLERLHLLRRHRDEHLL